MSLRCTHCATAYPPGLRYHCEACGWPLAVEYDGDAGPPREDSGATGVWRHHRQLPAVDPRHRVTLGEGGTPLLPAPAIAGELRLGGCWIKHEGVNPTGSFKDRGTAVGMGMALELGADTVVVSSTGNAGASLAAYAARAGLRAVVLASATVPAAKLGPISVHGADIVAVDGSVSDAFRLGCAAASRWGWMNLTSTFVNPYTVEGNKTVGYELYRELPAVPDYILVPVSVGPLLVGIHRAFAELRAAGRVDRTPRLVAVQAEGCAPIVRAFAAGDDAVAAWTGPADTIAGGIADPLTGYERDATHALSVVRASGGFAIACSDAEILDATHRLACREGVFAQPTGAVSAAGLRAAVERGLIGSGDTAVCVVTGHGLKEPAAAPSAPPAVEPSLEALERALLAREVARA